MPNDTVPAAPKGLPTYTIDDILSDIGCLRELIGAASQLYVELHVDHAADDYNQH